MPSDFFVPSKAANPTISATAVIKKLKAYGSAGRSSSRLPGESVVGGTASVVSGTDRRDRHVRALALPIFQSTLLTLDKEARVPQRTDHFEDGNEISSVATQLPL